MPAGVQCFESGPFVPSMPHHMTRLGIRRRRNLLLRPDWLVTGGLLAGAVVILCLCVTLLVGSPAQKHHFNISGIKRTSKNDQISPL